jgi:hypothetical protein
VTRSGHRQASFAVLHNAALISIVCWFGKAYRTLRQRLDLIGHRFNSLIELPPVTGKISDDAYHPW